MLEACGMASPEELFSHLPEAVRRFAGRMQAEATRLSALVHEILKASSGKIVITVSPRLCIDSANSMNTSA